MYNKPISRKKRFTSLLTALLLVFAMTASFMPQEAWADTETTFSEDGLQYKVTAEGDTNTVEVTGPVDKKNDVIDVNIPAEVKNEGTIYTVTAIDEQAFYSCNSLTSITIPESVTSIGNYAFYSCNSLTSITIPESVTSIGLKAFLGCRKLESFSISAENPSFSAEGGVLFNKSLSTLLVYPGGKVGTYTLPGSVTVIADWAFSGCSTLASVHIPNSVKTIEENAFYNCTGLKSVTGMGGVETIRAYAFQNCTSLDSVTIPSSVTAIGDGTFYGCISLTSITMPNIAVGSLAFYSIGDSPKVLVMFKPGEKMEINQSITGNTSASDRGSVTWFRGCRSFSTGMQDTIDITVAPGSSYDLSGELGIKDTIYTGETGAVLSTDQDIAIPSFTLSGNTSKDTVLDDGGKKLTLGSDETGILLLRTYGTTIRVNAPTPPPAPSYYCTLTAGDVAFPSMEQGDAPQALPLHIHCTGNTGASVNGIRLDSDAFLLDDSKAEPYIAPGQTNATYLVVPKKDLVPGTYRAKATVTYSYGRTAEAEVTLTVTEAKQQAPSKLTTKSKGYRSVYLSWAKAPEAEKYQVYRAAAKNGTYKRISTTSKTSLTNIRLTTGKSYYYKVRAYRTVNGKKIYSAFTKAVRAVPKPSTPAFNLKAGKGRITVTWKGVSGATGYRIYRSTSKKGRYHLIRDSRGKARTYTSTGLKKQKTYYYKLRAYRIVDGKKVYSSYTLIQAKKTK